MIVDRLRATIVILKPPGNINTNPMMLKKYRVVEIMYCNERVIFRRSIKDGDWRCGVDCKIKCIYSDLSYSLGSICDIMRGIFAIDDIKYAYYPEKDVTEKI